MADVDGPCVCSCLFNAVGYVMEHTRTKASELRSLIAAVVASDPETYNEAFLGKPNDEYCRYSGTT
jgi:ubiquitin thioesterase OTU1